MGAPFRMRVLARQIERFAPLAAPERVAECREPMTEVGRLLCLERELTPDEWAFINAAEASNA